MADAPNPRDNIRDFIPKLIEMTEDVVFGDIWERTELSKRDRSLMVVSALIALGKERQRAGSVVEQQADDRLVPDGRGPQQRRPAVRVGILDRRSLLQQPRRSALVADGRSREKRARPARRRWWFFARPVPISCSSCSCA